MSVWVRVSLEKTSVTVKGGIVTFEAERRAMRGTVQVIPVIPVIPIRTRAPTILCRGSVGIKPRGWFYTESEITLGRTEVVTIVSISTTTTVIITVTGLITVMRVGILCGCLAQIRVRATESMIVTPVIPGIMAIVVGPGLGPSVVVIIIAML